jgi:glutamate-1-semialdehyde 2,1-aminomutase
MFAVKAARAITGRPAIAKFEGAYHGAYDWVEVSLDSSPQSWGADEPRSIRYAGGTPDSVLSDTVVLPFNHPVECAQILQRNASRLAAVIVDPLAARVGMVPAVPALREVLQECRERFGILLVLDEVISFRLSHGGAHAEFGLVPDLVALGKIIGGGLPVGAVAGPAGQMAVFDHTRGKPRVSHGGTFSANPLTMAAGLAALTAYDEPAVARLNSLGGQVRAEIAERLAERGLAAQVTGWGSLFRLHLTGAPIIDYRSCHPTSRQKQAIAAIHFGLLERGFLLTPNCSGALSTPMSAGDLHDLADAIAETAAQVRAISPWE